MGLETCSKLEVSSSWDSSPSSSLSVNLEARSAIELVCSFIDGGGPRRAGDGSAGSEAGSGSFLTGSAALSGGACSGGLWSDGTSVGSSPAYTLARSIFGGRPTFPSKYSAAETAGLVPKVGG